MSDIKLFSLSDGQATEIQGSTLALEKPLQKLIEANLEVLFGMRLLASEYSTGKTHGGRIDTLALDENNCPTIIEYKRSTNENVINQGLFYLDWLMDHQAEFKWLVLEHFGSEEAEKLDWSAPRLICIAGDFTRYDDHAVKQINRNIELIRYRQFGPDLLLLELANTVTGDKVPASRAVLRDGPGPDKPTGAEKTTGPDKSAAEWLNQYPPAMLELFGALEDYALSLGDDVQRKDLRLYVAFKRIRNFLTVVFQRSNLMLYLRLNPDQVTLEEGFSRDVRTIGHWGTGELEISVRSIQDLEKAKPLILQAYEGGVHAS